MDLLRLVVLVLVAAPLVVLALRETRWDIVGRGPRAGSGEPRGLAGSTDTDDADARRRGLEHAALASDREARAAGTATGPDQPAESRRASAAMASWSAWSSRS